MHEPRSIDSAGRLKFIRRMTKPLRVGLFQTGKAEALVLLRFRNEVFRLWPELAWKTGQRKSKIGRTGLCIRIVSILYFVQYATGEHNPWHFAGGKYFYDTDLPLVLPNVIQQYFQHEKIDETNQSLMKSSDITSAEQPQGKS